MTSAFLAFLLPLLLFDVAATRAYPGLPEAESPTVAKFGSAQDPVEDTHFYFSEIPPPDLRSAEITLSSTAGLSLTARFVPGTFSATTTAVHFTLYSQEPTEPSACGDYLVGFNVAGAPQGQVQVQRHTQGRQYEDVGEGAANLMADGVTATVPADMFGEDLASLTHWHVVVAIRVRENAESRILDYLPDTDLPAATLE